jgi:thiol:disulfide interchange protein DsbD
MKRIFLFFIGLFFVFTLKAQEAIQWEFNYNEKTSQVEIVANIKDGWHLYSQHIKNDVGPIPTSITFKSSDDFQLIGAVAEPKPIQKYDENFEATLDFFEHKAVFSQKVKSKKTSVLEGSVTFMVCNETMCLPPVDKQFKISIPKN